MKNLVSLLFVGLKYELRICLLDTIIMSTEIYKKLIYNIIVCCKIVVFL